MNSLDPVNNDNNYLEGCRAFQKNVSIVRPV